MKKSRGPFNKPNPAIKELISEKAIKKRIVELGQAITEFYLKKGVISEENPLCVVAILKGSVIFFSELIKEIKLPVNFDFIEVSSYGDETKSSGIVKILKDFSQSIRQKHLLVIEDIIDTGLTLNYLHENFNTRHPLSIEIVTLLIKKYKTRLNTPVRFIGFEIDDHYVVGFGMDYKGLHRNYPAIGVLSGKRTPESSQEM